MAKRNPNLKYYRDIFKYAERREELIRKAFDTNSKLGSRRYKQMLTKLDQGYARYNWGQIKGKQEKKPRTPEPSKNMKMKKMEMENFKISESYGVGKEFQFNLNIRGYNLADAIYKASKALSIKEKEELVAKIKRDIEGEKDAIYGDGGESEPLKITDQYDELIDGILRNGKIPYKAKDKLKNNTIFKTELITALIRKYNEGNVKEAFRKASARMTEILNDRGVSNKYVDKIGKERYVKF